MAEPLLAAAAVDEAEAEDSVDADDAEPDASSVAGVFATAEGASTSGEAEPSSPLSAVVPQAALSAVLRPVERAIEALGLKSPTLSSLGGYLPTNPLGEDFFSQVPLRYGDYIAKFNVTPESDSFKALKGKEVKLDDPNVLREAVIDELARHGGAWTLNVQLCRDLKKMPVEDASVEWSEKLSPYQPVATISVPAQEAWSPDRAAKVDERIAFRPWHGVEAHRPLGNIMRARRHVYPSAAEHRSKLTGCPLHEPCTLPDL